MKSAGDWHNRGERRTQSYENWIETFYLMATLLTSSSICYVREQYYQKTKLIDVFLCQRNGTSKLYDERIENYFEGEEST